MKSVYIFGILAALLQIGLAVDVISVHDLKLYVNCKEFIVKGMAYNPVPLGYKNMSADLTGGAGFCSPKRTPFGEWKSACYDSDYFDGSSDVPDRYPPGPADGWFQAVWERDFPIMQDLGINTLRLYNANPTTRQATVEQLGTNGISEAVGKNHIPFMDMAAKYGFKVIFPLVGDQTILTTSTDDTIKQLLRNQIDEVGNHSALLMWSFSNELPLATDESLVTLLNKYIPYIRSYTQSKWNRFIPVTAAVVDIPTSYNHLVATLDVDIFSSNAGYRGIGFQDLWTGAATPGFDGFANLSREYNKPLLISEIGWHQLNNSITRQIPDWFNQIYGDLVQNIDNGCIGGVFFEYSDEPYSKVDPLQQDMGVIALEPSTDSNGKSSTQPDVWTPDTAVKKPIIYDSLKSGTFNGKQYNFNADVFTLMGRSQTVLENCQPGSSSSTGSNTNGGSTTGSVAASTTGAVNNYEDSAATKSVAGFVVIGLIAVLMM